MSILRELVKSCEREGKKVYVHLSDRYTAEKFLQDAEKEGFIFADGVKPTARHISDFMAIHGDMTINYVGYIGRMAYSSGENSIICINYVASR